ncbi:DUF4097 family beta strand repeat-containing protein [Streptomyces sp. NPDC090025]|uniref:DUF4097 family beta strand repeat-containing protein n=1 Tax=Streptomyces sp. NPDC090025 TaxID=3365922 RepID=UPI0038325F1A
MQKFPTAAPVTVVVDLPAGRIQLIAADRADATVDIRPLNPAKTRDAKAAEKVRVDYADGVLRIESPQPENRLFGSSGHVEVTVQLPVGSRVRAKAAAADLRGVGRLGDVDFETAQGEIKLDETGAARLAVQAGSIVVGRLGGPATLSTQKGDLRVDEAKTGTVELSTQKGDITVGAARGVSATLDAGTGYGRVANTLRNDEGAASALRFKATTAYGDITARSL